MIIEYSMQYRVLHKQRLAIDQNVDQSIYFWGYIDIPGVAYIPGEWEIKSYFI